MSEQTGISWTDRTWNPWTGCRRVSAGCKNCYMFALLKRWGRDATERRKAADWKKPLRWNNEAGKAGKRYMIFPSMCDWLDNEVPIEWLADFLKLIHDTPNLDWLLLTKRPENFKSRVDDCGRLWGEDAFYSNHLDSGKLSVWISKWVGDSEVPANVWIGVSVEDQKRADERIPLLLQIPAKVRFLSVEPLLTPVKLLIGDTQSDALGRRLRGESYERNRIDWVIVGGESGGGRRDCGVEAICDVARQCVAAGVSCHVKQDSAFKPGQQGRIPDDIWALKQFREPLFEFRVRG